MCCGHYYDILFSVKRDGDSIDVMSGDDHMYDSSNDCDVSVAPKAAVMMVVLNRGDVLVGWKGYSVMKPIFNLKNWRGELTRGEEPDGEER